MCFYDLRGSTGACGKNLFLLNVRATYRECANRSFSVVMRPLNPRSLQVGAKYVMNANLSFVTD